MSEEKQIIKGKEATTKKKWQNNYTSRNRIEGKEECVNQTSKYLKYQTVSTTVLHIEFVAHELIYTL